MADKLDQTLDDLVAARAAAERAVRPPNARAAAGGPSSGPVRRGGRPPKGWLKSQQGAGSPQDSSAPGAGRGRSRRGAGEAAGTGGGSPYARPEPVRRGGRPPKGWLKAQAQAQAATATAVPEADDSFSPYLNEGAHQHLQGGDLDAIASASAENRVLKVSAGSNPKTVAGSIAYVTRAGEAPALLALGASCINQAVKAVAIARGYVHEDGVDLALQPDFRDEERTSISLRLVKKGNGAYITELPSEAELTVSSRSEPTAVAGAVAAKVRGLDYGKARIGSGWRAGPRVTDMALDRRIQVREGERCAIVGIGAECVNKAVLAVTFARHFLRDNAVDLKAVPHFVKIERDGGETVSAMKLTILAEQC